MTKQIILTERDYALFLKEINNPMPPNEALIKAAARFHAAMESGNVVGPEKYVTFDDLRNASDKITIEDVRKSDDQNLLLQTNDAQIWAKSFIDTMKENNWTIEDIDEGLMITWFVNAMGAQEMQTKKAKLAKVSKGLRKLAR